MMKIYDVTRPIHTGMAVFEGDPEVEVRRAVSTETGAKANVSLLRFGSHTGTHVDAPAHFRDGAPGVDRLPLEVLIGPACVRELDVPEEIGVAGLSALDLAGCPRVLFKLRHPASQKVGWLTGEAARSLVQAGVKLVGLESMSVDPLSSTDFPAHRVLLDAGVVILEGLDLSAVPPGRYDLLCLPLKILNGDGAPARVVLLTRE